MPTYINTNLNSLNVQMALNASQAQQTSAMQRLATGLRINSAADNAAGFAIVTRMGSQIGGNMQAANNANDAISLTQTAAGDLTQITNNLQTMRNLAVQASNATNSASDRAALNNQLQALSSEIDRVAQSSSFNGVNLLDGTFTAQNFQVGANATAANQIQISSITSARTTQLGGASATSSATTTSGLVTGALTAGALTLNGQQVGASVLGAAPGQSIDSAFQVAVAINLVSSQSGVIATANNNSVAGAAATAFTAIAANTFNDGRLTVRLYTLKGAPVATLLDTYAQAGTTTVFWDGKTALGNTVASGVYLLRVIGQKIDVKEKIVVIK